MFSRWHFSPVVQSSTCMRRKFLLLNCFLSSSGNGLYTKRKRIIIKKEDDGRRKWFSHKTSFLSLWMHLKKTLSRMIFLLKASYKIPTVIIDTRLDDDDSFVGGEEASFLVFEANDEWVLRLYLLQDRSFLGASVVSFDSRLLFVFFCRNTMREVENRVFYGSLLDFDIEGFLLWEYSCCSSALISCLRIIL